MMRHLIFLTLICIMVTFKSAAQCSIDAGPDQNTACGQSVQLNASFPVWLATLTNPPYQTNDVAFPDDTTGFCVGSSGMILKTTDGGNLWSTLNLGYSDILGSLWFLNRDTGFAGSINGNIYRTLDGGANWTQLGNSGAGNNGICFTSIDTGFATGGAWSTISKTTNGGLTWFSQTTPNTYGLSDVYFIDKDHGCAAGFHGQIICTNNGGASWNMVNNGPGNVNINSIQFTDIMHGFAVSDSGYFYRTTDGGNTWQYSSVYPNYYNANDLSFIDNQNGMFAMDSAMYITSDGGITWNMILLDFNDVFQNAYNVCMIDLNNIITAGMKILSIDRLLLDSVRWEPATGLSDPGILDPVAILNQTNHYQVFAYFQNACSATDSVSVIVNGNVPSEICEVSVNDSNKNVILWNKPLTAGIDSFYLYRETWITNQFEKIATLSFSDSSIFVDTASHAEIQSNRYYLSNIDQCGNESQPGVVHKTMHLTISQGGTTWNLVWEPYEGMTVNTYKIYRGSFIDSLQLIGTTAGTSTQYSDFSAPSGRVYYQVEIIHPFGCTPSKTVYSSRSNIASNGPLGIDAYVQERPFVVFPNPSRERIFIQAQKGSPGNMVLEMRDILGNIIFYSDHPGFGLGKVEIDLSDINPGIYYLTIRSAEETQTEKILVIK